MALRLVLVTLFLALLFGGVFGWKFYTGQQKAAMMSGPQPPAVVSSAEVQSDTWQPALKAIGSLVASNGVIIANEVAGIMKSIEFKSGQSVDEGDVLLTLNDEVDRADIAALTASGKLAEPEFQAP